MVLTLQTHFMVTSWSSSSLQSQAKSATRLGREPLNNKKKEKKFGYFCYFRAERFKNCRKLLTGFVQFASFRATKQNQGLFEMRSLIYSCKFHEENNVFAQQFLKLLNNNCTFKHFRNKIVINFASPLCLLPSIQWCRFDQS